MARPASMSTSDLVQTQRLKRNKSWRAAPYRLETKPGATRGPAGGICGGHHVCSEYFVSLAGLTRCDIRVAGKQKWRKWEKHFTRLALPSSTGNPLSDPALRRDLAAAQWFRACELHGGAPVTLGEGEGGERGEGRGWECVASVFLPRPTCSIGMFECSKEFKSWIQDGTLPPKCRNFEMSNVQNAPSESRVQESSKSRQQKGQGSLPGPLPGV